MTTIWIVYHDSGPDNNILGVFDNHDEATEYQELVAPEYEQGALLSSYEVPWRMSDTTAELLIGPQGTDS
ncbi:hypothetical protein [Pseudoclavibacter helvolus]|uniref:hypothetical protein n=1 Tax=Pseudoclavibacter helvolus TaxID=255205 RepID=UPI000B1B00F7|nr:hypothetical protein [Pseudoclavibacter helvolus]